MTTHTHKREPQAVSFAQPLALVVVPPRAEATHELPRLETVVQSLALDARHPIALEIVGTATTRAFVVRATSPEAVTHLAAQVQARYPQAETFPLVDDPLHLRTGESASVVELRAGAAPYLSLRTVGEREGRAVAGTDPLLGVLAAFQQLPQDMRVVTQLALVPASATWSRVYSRKAIEHSLEPERKRERRTQGQSKSTSAAPSGAVLLALGVLVGLLVLWRFFARRMTRLVPVWLIQDGALLIKGKLPHLTPSQIVQIGIVVGVLLLVVLLGKTVSSRWGEQPLYDMRRVSEKTQRGAYHVRLRLLVIGPHNALPPLQRPRPKRGATSKASLVEQWGKYRGAWMAARSSFAERWTCSKAFLAKQWASGKNAWRTRRPLAEQWTTYKVQLGERWVNYKAQVREQWARDTVRCGEWWARCTVYLADQWTWYKRSFAARWVSFKARRAAQSEREAVLHRLIAAYRPFHHASGGYFVPHVFSARGAARFLRKRTGLWGRGCGWESGVRRTAHVLSIAEVLALWHLPDTLDVAEVPLLAHGRARTLLAPSEARNSEGWTFGISSHAGYTVPVALPRAGLRGNLLTVAATGKGKSTLFGHLAQAHLLGRQSRAEKGQKREGLVMIEPHGDLIASVCRVLPATLHDETVVLDLADQEYPIALNPLDMTLGRSRDKAVDTLLSIFKHIWGTSWGPRTENILEFALKTLADANDTLVQRDPQQGPDQQYTLLDVIPLLRLTGFRHTVFEQVTDESLRSWWRYYYETLEPRFQTEVISSVVNKMSKYSSSYLARRLLGQPRSSVNMKTVIAEGKILLISTASGVVGSDISALLGATLLGLFHSSLAEQAAVAPEERQQYRILIDEFQTYPGADYTTMLAELRKYGATFGLATQSLTYLDVLDRALRPTVLSNIDHLYAFAMSGEDAWMLLSTLEGCTIEDITNLDDFMCYVKSSHGGRRLPVFSMKLKRVEQGDGRQADHLRVLSRQRYAHPVGTVDRVLAQHHALVEAAALSKRTGNTTDEPSDQDSPGEEEKKDAPRRRGGGTKKDLPVTTPDGKQALSHPIIHTGAVEHQESSPVSEEEPHHEDAE